jgi:hypothetical protein
MSEYVRKKLKKPESYYIRVGTDFFKKIIKPDRFGIEREELKKWKQETIVLDFEKKFLQKKLETFKNMDDKSKLQSLIKNYIIKKERQM